MSVTIYDIAREASVGIGTVSRVLNDHPSVSDKTRQKVLDVARRLNYQPHAYAQGLARKKSNTISAIIPFFTNYFFVEVLQGVQERISQSGYDLIIYGVTASATNQANQLEPILRRLLQRGRSDGMLLFSMNLPSPLGEKLRQLKTPLVLVDAFSSSFDSITIDNKLGAYTATKHLLSLGHTRIGMISANLGSAPARLRLEGYRKALAEHGIPFDERYHKVSSLLKQDGFSREAGYISMADMLELGPQLPTAVFASSDVQAIGAINALRDRGLKVPDDMAVVGFDDIELAKHVGLTTMRQPMYEMGVLAVDQLIRRIQKPDLSQSHTHFEPKLVVRETCGSAIVRMTAKD